MSSIGIYLWLSISVGDFITIFDSCRKKTLIYLWCYCWCIGKILIVWKLNQQHGSIIVHRCFKENYKKVKWKCTSLFKSNLKLSITFSFIFWQPIVFFVCFGTLDFAVKLCNSDQNYKAKCNTWVFTNTYISPPQNCQMSSTTINSKIYSHREQFPR